MQGSASLCCSNANKSNKHENTKEFMIVTILWEKWCVIWQKWGVLIFLAMNVQLIQYSAAHLVTRTPQCSHITWALASLHRLPVKFRIYIKSLLIAYRALNNSCWSLTGPPQLSDYQNKGSCLCLTQSLRLVTGGVLSWFHIYETVSHFSSIFQRLFSHVMPCIYLLYTYVCMH